MALCSICKSIDLGFLLPAFTEESLEIGSRHKTQLFWHSQEDKLCISHHDDIFKVRESADSGCDMCRIIVSAFEDRRVEDEEIAKGLPVVVSKGNHDIVVSFDSSEGLIRLCGFDVYLERNSVHILNELPFTLLSQMHRDPGSQSCQTLAAGWLRDCVRNHAHCSATIPSDRKLPLRVLSVGDRARNPFLVEPTPDRQSEEWVALSYCWGGEPTLKLTKDTIRSLEQGIPLNTFDPTIRDAILVTRAIGITYLWVDALCILQDHDSKDWNEQSSKMSEIYGGSTVTIVAVDSSSVKQGFLKERELQYIPIKWSTLKKRSEESQRSTDSQHVYLSPSWDLDKDKLSGPWARRGWTMQEGLLPNRLLYYTSHQMVWKCCTALKYERGVTREPPEELARGFIEDGSETIWDFDTFTKFKLFPWYLQLLSDRSISEKYRLWYELIESYTPRGFKHIQDRLTAISGLAVIFGHLIEDDKYFAGLWRGDMVRGLLWHTSGAKLIPDRSGDENRAPSWSWASVGSNVTVTNDHANQESFRALAMIEDVEVDLIDPSNPFSAVDSGSVTIRGPLLHLARLYNKEWRCQETHISALERHISAVVEEESMHGVEEKYSSPFNSHYAAIQMLQQFPSIDRRLDLLVLAATGDISKKGIPVYRRVGVLTLQNLDQRFIASPELVEILEKSRQSLRGRLHPHHGPRRVRRIQGKEAFLELAAERWPHQTVVVI